MSKGKYIIFLLFFSIFQVHVFSSDTNADTQNKIYLVGKDPNKFILFKIDDIGNNVAFSVWKTFFDLVIDYNYTVDLGVVPHYQGLQISQSTLDYLHKLLNTSRVYLFNHGWVHIGHEFGDDEHDYDYMNSHIQQWDQFMQNNGLYRRPWTKILGAPGNYFNRTSNATVLSAMQANNYSGIYFSKYNGTTNDGNAGLDMEYVYVENIVNHAIHIRDTNEVIDIINNSTAKAVFIQLHPFNSVWNKASLKNLFDRVYNETDRTPINVDDYYRNYFIKDHPNYFLNNTFGYDLPPPMPPNTTVATDTSTSTTTSSTPLTTTTSPTTSTSSSSSTKISSSSSTSSRSTSSSSLTSINQITSSTEKTAFMFGVLALIPIIIVSYKNKKH